MAIKVMLADFLYNIDKGPSFYLSPLNIGYVASYASKIHGDKFNFSLYRNVDRFIEDFKKEPPGIIGFSQYIWNQDLTQNILKWIKSSYPQVISIFGGANVGSKDVDVNLFMKMNPLVDFCILFYGEYGFSEILERYLQCGGDLEKMKSEAIQGASFCVNNSRNETVHSFVDQFIIQPDDIPSPYLTGLMDSFLEEGYSPIIQCMKGCPYSCTYCCAANLKVGKFSTERVLNEIDYIYERTTSPALSITDDNFGLFERDLEIAKHLRACYDKNGYPNKLYLYYAKKTTKIVREMATIMKELVPYFISYQSRNLDTLKATKRYNIKDSEVLDIVHMCRENNVHVSSEMIFGLPYETKQSFIQGIEEVYKLNVDTIAIYNCKFFNGAALSRNNSIVKCQIKTRHRLYEDNFGIFKTYDSYGDIVACETDEISVESSSFSFQDFLDIRILGFWIELCFARKIYYEILKHLENYKIDPFRFLSNIIDGKFKMPDNVRNLFLEIKKKYFDELFDTHDDLKKFIKSKLLKNPEFKSKKINLYYIYMVLYSNLRKDLDSFIKESCVNMAEKSLSEKNFEEFSKPLDELFEYHTQKVVRLGSYDKIITGEYNYDFPEWEKSLYADSIINYRFENGGKAKIDFKTIIPGQFDTLFKNNEKKKFPFTWHNYIAQGNMKARCHVVKN